MKKLFIFLGVLVGLLVALVFALPFILPMDMIHQKVITLAHEKTGGELQINGKTSFSILPTPSITLNQISFKTSGQALTSTLVKANSIKVKVNFLPLLSKKVEVSQFVIYQPDIDITVLKETASKKGTAAPATPMRKTITVSGDQGADAIPLSDISLENVRIVDGTIRYSDRTSGTKELLEHINATVKLKDLDHPLSVTSDLVWHKKKIKVDTTVKMARVLLEKLSSPIDLIVSSPDMNMSFSGLLDRSKDLNVNGNLKMKSASVRNLLEWVGQDAPVPGGLQNLNIESDVAYTGKAIKLTDMQLHIDKSKMNGHLTLFTKEAKPRLTGKLTLDFLNLNTYLTKSKVLGWSSNNREYQVAANSNDKAQTPDTKLDFRGLKAINTDLDLTLGGMLYKKIKLDETRILLKIKNAVLSANLTDMNLYKGKGTGLMVLNGQKSRAAIKSKFNLRNLAVLPFLKDAANFAWLSGSGNIDFDITGLGTTVNGLKKTLNGTSNIRFSDGAIEGINIPQMLRGVTTGAMFGLSKSTTQKTDFSALTALLKIKNGVVHNDDLKLASPLLRISGKGTANLVTERLDYRVEPKLVASLEGQDGAKAGGINIPLDIKGTFSDPKVRPDMSAILQNPKELLKGVKNLGKSFKNMDSLKELGKNKQIKELFKGLF